MLNVNPTDVFHHFRRTEMLTIRDLTKEVDMSAVRGGHARGWCGDEDSRERFDSDDRDHGDRDGRDRDRHRCERNEDASATSFASVDLNLSSYGMYGATK
jgi:hypothetical protein